MIWQLLFVLFYFNSYNAEIYDAYYGVPLTEERSEELTANNAADSCTLNVEPCNETEGRRLDGTCNHIDRPSEGGYNTPQLRLLPAKYGDNFTEAKTASGKDYMLARATRQKIMSVGKATSPRYTQAMAYFTEFMVNDIISLHDTNEYIVERPYCCEEKGKTDYMCTPNYISDDDSTHQFSCIRCMNQTQPLSVQNQGCIATVSVPERIDLTTPAFDLGPIYYLTTNVTPVIRTYDGGLLKTEVVNGTIFPSDGNSSCTLEMVDETGCSRKVPNILFGSNLYIILFWRQHNIFATRLAEINPHWDDERLFKVARDINIAFYDQLMYYEMWPALLGKENMIEKGLISEDPGFRDLYDESVKQQVIEEFPYVCRWFHYTQEGKQKLYDENYNYLRYVHVGDYSKNVQKFANGNDLKYITIGSVFQHGGGIDSVIDPDIAERALGPLQESIDLGTQDMRKGRLFLLAGYLKYRNLYSNDNKTYTSFDEITNIFSEEDLLALQEIYEVPEDIELMPGIIREHLIDGGFIPNTAAYIMMEQLKLTILSDRHWYERSDRPNSFTLDQLYEIRNATLARLYCNAGDDFKRIQPKAFLVVSSDNAIVDCSEIPNINLEAWREETEEESS